METLKGLSNFVSEGLKNGSLQQKTFPENDTAQFKKNPFYKVVADKLIEQLEAGTAPWQKPWEDSIHKNPTNPVTGNDYKGMNSIFLSMQGRADSRWLTYKQAKSIDAQVKKGEKATTVTYVKLREEKTVYENGKPVIDSNGEKVKRTIVLEKPKYFSASVFNGEQIEGLPELEKKERTWEDLKRAEDILKDSGATIIHDRADTDFYSASKDEIHLPPREQFDESAKYYSTALHELGHWTGHEDRLNRDLSGKFSSDSYAKEELRAEISSLMVGNSLNIGHNPDNHAAYVKSWIKALKEDPKEILHASKDAEAIHQFIMEKERAVNKDSDIDVKINKQETAILETEKLNISKPEIMKLPEAMQEMADKFHSPEDKQRFIEGVNKMIIQQENQIQNKEATNIQVDSGAER